MNNNFELGEINTSAAYRLASQVVIPRLRIEVFPTKGAEPFSLRDAVYGILKDEVARENLTQAQLDTRFPVNTRGANGSLASITRWYVRNMLKGSGEILLSDTRGIYTLTNEAPSEEEQDEDEEDKPVTGSIYAYSFPSLKSSMIKVGRASGNVEDRIYQQLGAGNPETPTILQVWSVTDIEAMERAIHYVLKARGKWVETTTGAKEWFRTSVDEVEAIIKFVKGNE